jgi:IS4 transposase
MWGEVLARFEKQAPASVMARIALEQAMPADWIDEVFEANRQRQYPRELLFSTVVELMSLVCLGLRPSLHSAARKMENLPVSLAALYDKIKRTELPLLRALVQGSSKRLQPIVAGLGATSCVRGWQLRIVDGNHLPASEKRLAPLRELRGAALPGHSLVVYDPDLAQVVDLIACEDAYESERVGVLPLLDTACAGQIWIADRHFCTRTILQRCQDAQAGFIVRQPSKHPPILQEGPWCERGRCETGLVLEQSIQIDAQQAPWRRIELRLDRATDSEDTRLWLWSNLPSSIGAEQIADLYRRRWSIEGMFQRLESVLQSEIKSLGHPRAALLGFTVAVLAYNLLSVLKRCVEQAHKEQIPELDVSTFHLAQHVRSGYEGLLIALPEDHWPASSPQEPAQVVQRLLALARRIAPRQVATSKRGPKVDKPKGWVDGATARAHVSTGRVLKATKPERP